MTVLLNAARALSTLVTLSVAIVAECADGKIVRMFEYIDPSKSPA